jgi:hypothetical protein
MLKKIFLWYFLIVLLIGCHEIRSQEVLFNNGSFVTHPGSGPGGSDYSYLESPLINFGFGNQSSNSQRVADDFTVTGDGWVIDSIVFFQYQTGSSTSSTMTGTNIQIWNTSELVWGDPTTNRLYRSVWTGCYRRDDFSNIQRPVMRNTCVTPDLKLHAGNYNLDWQASGSLTSGPWCVPVTISGQMTTGDAQGYSDGKWSYLFGDSTEIYSQGLPFIIYGRLAGYPSSISINENYTFSDPYSLFSYRIIGLPGLTNFSTSSVIGGTPNENWTAFWDNGHSEEYMKKYDGSATFTFKPGNAFWITSESQISINKTVNSVPIDGYDTYEISLNEGSWTLISNPFEKDVNWNSVKAANGLDDNQTLWDWNGYWNNATTLQTGKGYYYLAPDGLSSLYIPYPGKKKETGTSRNETVNAELTLSMMENREKLSCVHIKFDIESTDDFDKSDVIMPTCDFETAGIRILAQQATGRNRELFVDSRKSVEGGQSYQIRLKNQSGRNLQVNCEGIENFPGQEIWLVSNRTNQRFNLKKEPVIDIRAGEETRTLLIGDQNYIDQQTAKIFSQGGMLFNCFPNPFSLQTTVGYSLIGDGWVDVAIYDITGRKVLQIVDRQMPAGYYETVVDAKNLGPGVYFCRMNFSGSANSTSGKVIRLVVY